MTPQPNNPPRRSVTLPATTPAALRATLSLYRDGAAFRFTPSGNATLLSTCFGVLLAEFCGDLPANPGGYDDVGDAIAAQQEPDGFWRDPQMNPSDLAGKHTPEYLEWQQSYFALHALDAIGRRPKYPPAFARPFTDADRAVRWLRERDYVDFWYGSNEIMWLMSFLAWMETEGSAAAGRALDAMLDELDATQDPKTGFWGTDRGATLLNGMAGAFHVYYFYFWRRRPVKHVEAIIDNTLALQQPDGLFHPGGGGGSCHDLDAVDILVKFSLISSHRETDVARALERARRGLLTTRNPDGSFCERRWRPPRSWKRRIGEALGLDRLLNRPNPAKEPLFRNAGWSRMECRMNESNIWATWFRPLALALIQTRYPDRHGDASAWTFRRLPGLGWHEPRAIVIAGDDRR